MASVAYVLTSVSWQYNDNWYYPEGRHNLGIYLKRVDAEAAIERRFVEWIRNHVRRFSEFQTSNNNGDFLIDIENDRAAYEAFCKVFNALGRRKDDCSDEDILALIDFISDDDMPFRVEEVEIIHPLS